MDGGSPALVSSESQLDQPSTDQNQKQQRFASMRNTLPMVSLRNTMPTVSPGFGGLKQGETVATSPVEDNETLVKPQKPTILLNTHRENRKMN